MSITPQRTVYGAGTDATSPASMANNTPETGNNASMAADNVNWATFYEKFRTYPFATDLDFMSGLSQVIPAVDPPVNTPARAKQQQTILEAKCYYFSLKYKLPSFSLSSYQAWLRSKYPSQGQAASSASASGSTTSGGRSQQSNTTASANASFFLPQTDGASDDLSVYPSEIDNKGDAFEYDLNALTSTPNTVTSQQNLDIIPNDVAQQLAIQRQHQLSRDALASIIATGQKLPGAETVPEGTADTTIKFDSNNQRTKPWNTQPTTETDESAKTKETVEIADSKGAYGEDLDRDFFIKTDQPWYATSANTPAATAPTWGPVRNTANTKINGTHLVDDSATFPMERSMYYE